MHLVAAYIASDLRNVNDHFLTEDRQKLLANTISEEWLSDLSNVVNNGHAEKRQFDLVDKHVCATEGAQTNV